MLTAGKQRSVQCCLLPPGGGGEGGAKSVEVFQRGVSAVTLSYFVLHTEIINFLNYYHGIRFVGRKKKSLLPQM